MINHSVGIPGDRKIILKITAIFYYIKQLIFINNAMDNSFVFILLQSQQITN